jgi:integrase
MSDHSVSGHAYLRPHKSGKSWYAKLRYYPSRHDRRIKLGDAWTQKSAPPIGFLTKRGAEAQLQELLVEERRRLAAPSPQHSDTVTFGAACSEWLRWTEVERGRRDSTIAGYRNAIDRVLVPAFGAETSIRAITSEDVENFKQERLGRLATRTINKYLIQLFGIFKRAERLGWVSENVLKKVDRLPQRRSNRFDHLEPNEVAMLTAKAADPQEGALYTTAAFTGLRWNELRQLRWEDVSFEKALVHVRHQTKSHLARSVPLIDAVAAVLDLLSRREHWTGPDDLVFVNEVGRALDHSKMSKAYKKALKAGGLNDLRFHDLRHTFGTIAVRAFPLSDVKEYMGHADIKTTMIYVHHVPQHDAAAKLGQVMAVDQLETREESHVPGSVRND